MLRGQWLQLLGQISSFRRDVGRHMHASALSAGHMGRDRTYKRLRDKAWWPGYCSDMYERMHRCVACQLAKLGRDRMPLVCKSKPEPPSKGWL
jgi:hypothetical protein